MQASLVFDAVGMVIWRSHFPACAYWSLEIAERHCRHRHWSFLRHIRMLKPGQADFNIPGPSTSERLCALPVSLSPLGSPFDMELFSREVGEEDAFSTRGCEEVSGLLKGVVAGAPRGGGELRVRPGAGLCGF
mgnify:CR=1 FL=1